MKADKVAGVDRDAPQPLYAQIADNIRADLIRRGAGDPRLPSERELCGRLRVSRGTVRKALALLKRNGVAESCGPKRRIAVSRGLGDIRRKALPQSTGIILLGNLSHYVQRRQIETLEYASGIVEVSAEKGQSVTFINLPADPNDIDHWHAHLRTSVFGVVHFGVAHENGVLHPAQERLLNDCDFPQVFLGIQSMLPHVASVVVDARPGFAAAVEYLREMGHRRVGLLVAPPRQTPSRVGVQACASRPGDVLWSLEQAGLQTREEWICRDCESEAEVAAAVSRLLASRPRPTALFCHNDAMAEIALRILRQQGVSVPAGLSVVGCDDAHMAGACDPPLTTIRYPRHRVGAKCFELLAALRENGGGFHEVVVSVPATLVIRASTGAPAREYATWSQV
ncbi:MAG TPA: GntR family transcriptional regulator [Candidatus Brocadiia bacterium]|nr:GntR family transcriptional regulator [Candidatus Brocadiia bacterium]